MSEVSFEDVVRKYADTVYRVALNICKNPEDSRDIMQNVFLRYFKKQNLFSSQEHIKAWLIRVAVNESKRLVARNTKENHISFEELGNTACDFSPVDSDVFKEVMKLEEKYRTVIYLYYYEGYPVKDIAHILRRNQATVRTQLARGRELLKDILKEDNYG